MSLLDPLEEERELAREKADQAAGYDRPSFLGTKGPASIRSNNPGAMWNSGFAKKHGSFGGQKLADGLGQNNSIAYFNDVIDGGAALFLLIDAGYTGRSVRDAIKKWSGGNHVASYLTVLKSRGGIDPDDMITKERIRDAVWAVRFAKAMAWHEAGREYPMTELHWQAAHRQAFTLTVPPVPAKKAVAAASTKYKAAGAAKMTTGIMGLGAGGISAASQQLQEAKTIVDTVGSFLASYGVTVLVAVCGAAYLLFSWFQQRQVQDYEEGRYDPSGGWSVDK